MYTKHDKPSVNSGSMADIAFLLLIFFLVTTTIQQDKGLMLKLPPMPEEIVEVDIHERNLFKILINAQDQYLVEGDIRTDVLGLSEEVKTFVMNRGKNPSLSDSPKDAIISIKASRGTSYQHYIAALDEVKRAYYSIYGDRVGLSPEAYVKLDRKNPRELKLYQQGKQDIPMNISIAEPD